MGLDMYFTSIVPVEAGHKEDQEFVINARFKKETFMSLPYKDIAGIEYNLGYMRKSYIIHDWLCHNEEINNCSKTCLSEDLLKRLLSNINIALDNEEKCEAIFGVRHDIEGVGQLKIAEGIIKKCLEHISKFGAYIYYEPWW